MQCFGSSADNPSRYTDSPDGDWVIGRYPGDSGLVLATGGSRHAFKVYSTLTFTCLLHHAVMTGYVSTFHFFFPTLGKLVVDAIENKLDPKLAARFAVDRQVKPPNGKRKSVVPQELNIDELCEPEDLIPTL
ncbi:hypothetical protein BD769DRAFT_1613721 [Suillus cothurnatus]|nr:hypothetical protein BD769DRAFT_1613721 [Suillus cothurnatus]